MEMTCKAVTNKNSEISRKRALAIINTIQKKLKEDYKFSFRLVGSATRNTIVEDKDGQYDLDYQLCLTNNSKGSLVANVIKPKFLSAFDKAKNENETIENSTTAITVKNKVHKYSIDFVIIKLDDNPNSILRKKNNPNNPTMNNYFWNQLPKINEAYSKFDDMTETQKKDVCNNYIIPRKCKEKQKPEDSRVSSMRIFVEEVNNYGG